MYHHFILLHSDYSHGRRIAFHKYGSSVESIESFVKTVGDLKNKFPHLSFGFHHLQTDEKSWESVMNYDMFFSDVFPVNDLDSFKRLILEDDQINALDVANLITSKISCTHLKLQKLLFFFYCRYIKKNGSEPFKEKFLAWDYGPVIKEVYDKYKVYGRDDIKDVEDNTEMIIKEDPFKLSVYSRFMKTLGYGRILESLDDTLMEYSQHSASELVDLTHLTDTPWDQVYKKGLGRNSIIDADLIRRYTQ